MRVLREIAGYLPIWTKDRPTGPRTDVVERHRGRHDHHAQQDQHDASEENDAQSEQERRGAEQENRARRTIFDFLYDEVDRMVELTAEQRQRVKDNLRDSLTREAASLGLSIDGSTGAENAIAEIMQTALPQDSSNAPAEDRRIAEQLHYCLEQNTDTTRKISVYLRAIRSIGENKRPMTLRQI